LTIRCIYGIVTQLGGGFMPRKPRNELVKKSNALIRGGWTIESVWEPRIVAHVASRITMEDKNFMLYEIPISDVLGREYGGHDLDEIEKVVDGMMGRVITILEPDHPKIRHKYNVFSRCTINGERGVLEVFFHPDLKPHYLELKERFTQYRLAEFLSLPSTYSQRMFEILMSWNDKPEVIISLDELHEMLNFPVALRGNFFHFRKKVLEQAEKDIVGHSGNTSLWFSWEPMKQGRKVSAIRFTLGKREARGKKAAQLDDEAAVKKRIALDSAACFLKLHRKRTECTPNDSAKCRFCVEEGSMRFILQSRALKKELVVEGTED
jgi:plasmid replication initiation protein